MKSFKTILAIGAMILSVSAVADRGRDVGERHAGSKYHGAHNSRNQVKGQSRHSHKHGRSYNERMYRSDRHSNRHDHPGFDRDYRDNRHFDRSNRRHYSHDNRRHHNNRRYHNDRRYGYNHYGAHGHSHHKPYRKWKNRLKKHRKYWRKHNRWFHAYRPYEYDDYRYRPLRGLGHYFFRTGYGYGHWHEGMWCPDYHSEAYYRDYYSYYPYRGGWRFGDGDFGIWFSF